MAKKNKAKEIDRPLRWFREASPAEIGEMILSLPSEKYVEVMVYVAHHSGPEIKRRIERARAKVDANPGRTLMRGLSGFLGALDGS
jgi:NADPH-dependent 7-cyano-7-deazaguanine reductase QueF